jgi:hypothetical protein
LSPDQLVVEDGKKYLRVPLPIGTDKRDVIYDWTIQHFLNLLFSDTQDLSRDLTGQIYTGIQHKIDQFGFFTQIKPSGLLL